ncbi:hypothetical protein SLEP1_g49413 [Rubroshorea leprosula]|uniref:Uncharacterized protein n=1 Tax=Rubroshorea leprosula TaxID=152421 RepID=A0AAV5LWQ7_9ROSI|nr:hypothetical protein SLEP1_g49413 [Rubroshorea leprosula]
MFAGSGFCLPKNSGKLPALPSPIYPCSCCLVPLWLRALGLSLRFYESDYDY